MRHKDVISRGSGEQLALSLIDDIYSAALDPSLWKGLVRRIVEAVGGATGQLHSNSEIVLESLWAPHGFGEEVMGQYAQYYHQQDEWTLAADATGFRACRAVTGEELVQFGNFKNSEFYNDFLKKFDFERIVCCYIDEGMRGDLPKTALCAYRPPGSEPFDADAIKLLNIVAPHVLRAVQLHWSINDLDHERASKTEVLEHLSVGVALVDDELRVTYLNQAARSIVNANCGLTIVDGELVASFVAEAAELSRSIGAAVRAVVCLDSSVPTESMTVSRTTKGSPYRLTIIPLPVKGGVRDRPPQYGCNRVHIRDADHTAHGCGCGGAHLLPFTGGEPIASSPRRWPTPQAGGCSARNQHQHGSHATEQYLSQDGHSPAGRTRTFDAGDIVFGPGPYATTWEWRRGYPGVAGPLAGATGWADLYRGRSGSGRTRWVATFHPSG